MTGQAPLPLPLPEPPDDAVLALIDDLRLARGELREAYRVVTMVAGHQTGETTPHDAARLRIESRVAELRAELWAAEVERQESRARAAGLDA